ncbi:chemotaxis protein CheB [Dyella ginsengisoli]|uniref:protein-glutamate methylesterase n=1 Tax=Dyella ginsengisoli TaxID=363848 RepID=A0ABW8JSN3_9GAMM
MAEATAVALLFDDAELGAHLREALHERGASIVHEGGLADLSRALLDRIGADVVVINLDETDDEVFDRLDESIQGDHPRVVFNEADSTRALDGWARARWARHLAAKVMARSDVDPPRPLAAEPEMPAAGVDNSIAEASPVIAAAAPEADLHEAEIAAESESLEAELEALLSGDPLPGEAAEDTFSSTEHTTLQAGFVSSTGVELDTRELDDFELDELALGELDQPLPESPLYDGNFLDAAAAELPAAEEPQPSAPPATRFSTEGLSLLDHDADLPAPTPVEKAPAGEGTARFNLSDEWSLVDEDAVVAAPPAPPRPSASDFGIEKISALDFLTPESEAAGPIPEPFMTLELVSLEEAIAPRAYDAKAGGEMLLEELSGGLSRVVLTGATVGSRASVAEFLRELPQGFRATIVHIQHLGGRPVDELVEELGSHCTMPVRAAVHGQFARPGEIIVVPPDGQLRLTRDGKLEIAPSQDVPASSPSIDASFTAVANVFGVDALAIVFAGQANDAVAGCQAVHDRGGRIWVEDAQGEHYADMVGGVLAEHLADFSGTPAQLAARLIEEY